MGASLEQAPPVISDACSLGYSNCPMNEHKDGLCPEFDQSAILGVGNATSRCGP